MEEPRRRGPRNGNNIDGEEEQEKNHSGEDDDEILSLDSSHNSDYSTKKSLYESCLIVAYFACVVPDFAVIYEYISGSEEVAELYGHITSNRKVNQALKYIYFTYYFFSLFFVMAGCYVHLFRWRTAERFGVDSVKLFTILRRAVVIIFVLDLAFFLPVVYTHYLIKPTFRSCATLMKGCFYNVYRMAWFSFTDMVSFFLINGYLKEARDAALEALPENEEEEDKDEQ